MAQEDLFKKIIAHAKEYGFVFPSSEIYDGLSAVYDYGQNGVEMKYNIRAYWWDAMVNLNENIVGIDSAIFKAFSEMSIPKIVDKGKSLAKRQQNLPVPHPASNIFPFWPA